MKKLFTIICLLLTIRLITHSAPPYIVPGPSGVASFNPNQLTNLILWWNGDYNMTNNGGTNNAPITKAYDFTIHQNDGYTNLVNSGDLTKGPYIVSNAINGHALMRFTGTNYFLVKTNFFTNFFQGELWAVIKNTDGGNVVPWGFASNTAVVGDAAYPNASFSKGPTNTIQENFGSWIAYDAMVPTENYIGLNITNNYHIFSCFTGTNFMILSIDGEMLNGGNNIKQGMLTNASVGAGLSGLTRWVGDIVDLYIFNYWNSELNRSNMLGYLTNLYAIPVITNTHALSAGDTNQWNPTNYLSSMHCWINATNFDHVVTNNAPIGTNGLFWLDQSGHGNDWTNITLAQMPRYVSNYNGNGVSAVHFDASDDRLFCRTNLNLPNTNDITIWAVFAHTNNASQNPLWSKTGSALYARTDFGGLNTMGWSATTQVAPDNGSFQNTNITPQVAVFQRTNGVWTIWRNMEAAQLYTAGGGNRTNVNNIQIDTWGFHVDFGVSSDLFLFEFAIITNRFLPSWDIINLYRFYHKPNNPNLP